MTVITFRPNENDEHQIEIIAEYLASNRPDLPEPKKSQVFRYALWLAATRIEEELAKEAPKIFDGEKQLHQWKAPN